MGLEDFDVVYEEGEYSVKKVEKLEWDLEKEVGVKKTYYHVMRLPTKDIFFIPVLTINFLLSGVFMTGAIIFDSLVSFCIGTILLVGGLIMQYFDANRSPYTLYRTRSLAAAKRKIKFLLVGGDE